MCKKNGCWDIPKHQLEMMRNARMGVESIAKAFGCHSQTIKARLKEYGMPTRLPDIDFTDDQIKGFIKAHKAKPDIRPRRH